MKLANKEFTPAAHARRRAEPGVHQGRAAARRLGLSLAWARTRTLDSHASRLRRKLDPEHGRYVVNCWGVGYRLIDAPEAGDADPIAEAALVACPLALTCATVVAADRRTRRRRRRELLNRALHELRRPLQALAARRRAARPGRRAARDQLDQALEALDGLDRQVNGGRGPSRPRARRRRGRWRARRSVAGAAAAALAGTLDRARLARAGRRGFAATEGAISRALDNLIANALEHGSGPIRRRRHRARRTSLRLTVADGADAGRPCRDAGRDDRRRAPSPGRRPPRPRPADRRRGRRRARRAVRRLRPRTRRQRGAGAAAGGRR